MQKVGRNVFKTSDSENDAIEILQRLRPQKIKSIGISTAGYFESLFAELGAEVVATTIDAKGLEYTQENVGEAPGLELRLEDVREKMPEPDGTYDAIYSRLCLHYLSDAELKFALHECHRVLKNKGILLIIVKSAKDWTAKTPGAFFDQETGFTYTPNIKRYANQYRRLHTRESITEALKEAKFEVSCISELHEEIYVDFERTEIEEFPAALLEVFAHKR